MTSYEIIGSIAVLGEDATLKQAREILKNNKNITTITKRTGEIKGKYRIKKVKHLLGKKTTLTTHKENGIKILIDINKAYYSPRLQNERQRIMKQVKENEIIIDMFSGVGPYTIAIAKNTKASHIYALDHNPSAIKLLKKNIELNKIKNVTPLKGDALKLIKDLLKADRIIMNAPRQNNTKTLNIAKTRIKKGGIIHYYTTSEEKTPTIKELKKINEHRVIEYAPGKSHICIDYKRT